MNEQEREAVFEAMRKTDVLVKELGDTVTPAFARFGEKWSALIGDLAERFPDMSAAGANMLIDYLKTSVEKVMEEVEAEVTKSAKSVAAQSGRTNDA